MEGKEGGKELRKKEVGRGGKEEDEERKEVKRGRIVRKKMMWEGGGMSLCSLCCSGLHSGGPRGELLSPPATVTFCSIPASCCTGQSHTFQLAVAQVSHTHSS